MSLEPQIRPQGAATSALARFTDAAQWRSLVASSATPASSEAWLALFCASLDLSIGALVRGEQTVACAMLALGEPDSGRYARVARYGPQGVDSLALAKAAERALVSRRALVQPGETTTAPSHIAQPILLEGKLHGVVAVELIAAAAPHLEAAMRLAQWSIAWLGWKLGAGGPGGAGDTSTTDASTLIEAMSHAASGPTIASGSQAVSTFLAETLGAARIAIGVRRRHTAELLALSHGGAGKVVTTFLEALRGAMDEAAAACRAGSGAA